MAIMDIIIKKISETDRLLFRARYREPLHTNQIPAPVSKAKNAPRELVRINAVSIRNPIIPEMITIWRSLFLQL
jgi:hypothetical protein